MFNDYIWKTYLKADGEDIVAFFKRSLCGSFTEDYARKSVSSTKHTAQVKRFPNLYIQN